MVSREQKQEAIVLSKPTLGERKFCRILKVSRTGFRNRLEYVDKDKDLKERIRELAYKHKRAGFCSQKVPSSAIFGPLPGKSSLVSFLIKSIVFFSGSYSGIEAESSCKGMIFPFTNFPWESTSTSRTKE